MSLDYSPGACYNTSEVRLDERTSVDGKSALGAAFASASLSYWRFS